MPIINVLGEILILLLIIKQLVLITVDPLSTIYKKAVLRFT